MSEILIKVLEMSAEKHGANKPLTIGHLLNIIKLSKRVEEAAAMSKEDPYQTILREVGLFKT